MKDARGHGSNKGRLPGAAAHRSVVQKLYQNGEHHQAMAHALTRYDREQEHKGKGYNTYALGHYWAPSSASCQTFDPAFRTPTRSTITPAAPWRTGCTRQ